MLNDPFNLIITGVGGQGNVVASQLVAQALVKNEFLVTVGETYGLSQRGGAVMSHLRISRSRRLGPCMPKGTAHVIMSLEPVEALRVMPDYGNTQVVSIVNSRPLYPLGVIAGERDYPDPKEVKRALQELSERLYWVDATRIAMDLGNPIMANVVMTGALMGTGLLPISSDDVMEEVKEAFPRNTWDVNLKAFNQGVEAVSS